MRGAIILIVWCINITAIRMYGYRPFSREFIRREYAKLWATGYGVPAVQDGHIIKAYIPNKLPQGMQGFAMDLRRPVFADIAVRKAMVAFDFEWSISNLPLVNAPDRYFENSDMQAAGVRPMRQSLRC